MIQTFKKPDLKAPRFRKTRLSLLSHETFIKDFIRDYPKYKDIKFSEIRDIVSAFHIKLWQTVLDTRDGIELPENIGFIFLGTCQPPKKKAMNQIGRAHV